MNRERNSSFSPFARSPRRAFSSSSRCRHVPHGSGQGSIQDHRRRRKGTPDCSHPTPCGPVCNSTRIRKYATRHTSSRSLPPSQRPDRTEPSLSINPEGSKALFIGHETGLESEEPILPPDVRNLTLKSERSDTAYTVTAAWENTGSSENVSAFELRQSRDDGKTWNGPENLRGNHNGEC